MNNDRLRFRYWYNDEYHRINNFYVMDNGNVHILIHPRPTVTCRYPEPIEIIDNKGLEQCTGLKDKNGKLIYEGDVIKHSQADKNTVIWCFGGWHYTLHQLLNPHENYHAGAIELHPDNEFSEIIGNIHEELDK